MDNTAKATDCYYFGCLHGDKCVAPSVNTVNGVTLANALLWKHPLDGYFLGRYRHTSFLTCKISDHTATGTNVIIVPFKNEALGADLTTVLLTTDNTNLIS